MSYDIARIQRVHIIMHAAQRVALLVAADSTHRLAHTLAVAEDIARSAQFTADEWAMFELLTEQYLFAIARTVQARQHEVQRITRELGSWEEARARIPFFPLR